MGSTAGATADRWKAVLVVAGLALSAACAGDGSGGDGAKGGGDRTPVERAEVRIDELQLIGSHNSYHVAQPDEKIEWMAEAVKELNLDVGDPLTLAYTHAPLDAQLDAGVRSFELDVSAPTGPKGSEVAVVEHIPNLDPTSTCPDLASCLGTIVEWMDRNPDHVPIPVLVELKSEFSGEQLDALDGIIRAAVGDSRLLVPDEVRGSASSLSAAVEADGWPTLGEAANSMFLLMDNGGANSQTYLQGHSNLEGRVLFTTDGLAEDGSIRGDAAALKINNPGDEELVREMVDRGYVVRTRADADLAEAKANDTARRAVAFDSGAQIVSTDYPPGEPRQDNGYVVTFGGTSPGVRCNPVNKPAACPSPLEG
jgi:hypothetical protein